MNSCISLRFFAFACGFLSLLTNLTAAHRYGSVEVGGTVYGIPFSADCVLAIQVSISSIAFSFYPLGTELKQMLREGRTARRENLGFH